MDDIVKRLQVTVPNVELNADAAAEIQRLREWAKLAFRELNNVGPELLGLETESSSEAVLNGKLYAMVEAAVWQYLAITNVSYIDAIHDARAALAREPA